MGETSSAGLPRYAGRRVVCMAAPKLGRAGVAEYIYAGLEGDAGLCDRPRALPGEAGERKWAACWFAARFDEEEPEHTAAACDSAVNTCPDAGVRYYLHCIERLTALPNILDQYGC